MQHHGEKPPDPVDNSLENGIEWLFDELRNLNRMHGKNFRNLLIDKIQCFDGKFGSLPIGPDYPTYLEDTSIETILNRIRGRITDAKSFNHFGTFQPMDRILEKKEEYIRDLPQIELGEDWGHWHRWIIRQCILLNKAHPNDFVQLLSNFLTPLHWKIIAGGENFADVPLFNPQDPEDVIFTQLLKYIENYKQSEFCGFMFKVLVPWLETKKRELIKEGPTQMGTGADDDKELFPVDPNCKGEDVTVKRGRMLYLELGKLSLDDGTSSSEESSSDNNSPSTSGGQHQVEGLPEDASVGGQSTFQVSLPFPSKGGFTAEVLQNNQHDEGKCFYS